MAGVKEVKNNIAKIYQRKRTATVALCEEYGALALQRFKQKQSGNKFWNNQTKTAMNTVFYGAFSKKDFVGFFLAHAVEYGIYLELANNRQNESLRPTVMAFYLRFERDLQELWG